MSSRYLIVWETLSQSYDTGITKHIRETAFAVRRKPLQLVSITNHFIAFVAELGFQVFPVITVLGIIILRI